MKLILKNKAATMYRLQAEKSELRIEQIALRKREESLREMQWVLNMLPENEAIDVGDGDTFAEAVGGAKNLDRHCEYFGLEIVRG